MQRLYAKSLFLMLKSFILKVKSLPYKVLELKSFQICFFAHKNPSMFAKNYWLFFKDIKFGIFILILPSQFFDCFVEEKNAINSKFYLLL